MTDNATVLADLDAALAGAGRLVAGIGPAQWTAPTPCAEHTVAALVNHMVSGNVSFAARLRGAATPDRGADYLGEDPRAAFDGAANDLRNAFAAPGVLESTYPSPFGQVPAGVMAGIRVVEMLTHGWDLARATGQRPDLPEDVTERALARVRQQLTPERRHPAFGPEVEVAADAPAIDRLAGFLGRQV